MEWYHSNWTPADPCCRGNEIFACYHKSLAYVKQRRAIITLGFATLYSLHNTIEQFASAGNHGTRA